MAIWPVLYLKILPWEFCNDSSTRFPPLKFANSVQSSMYRLRWLCLPVNFICKTHAGTFSFSFRHFLGFNQRSLVWKLAISVSKIGMILRPCQIVFMLMHWIFSSISLFAQKNFRLNEGHVFRIFVFVCSLESWIRQRNITVYNTFQCLLSIFISEISCQMV